MAKPSPKKRRSKTAPAKKDAPAKRAPANRKPGTGTSAERLNAVASGLASRVKGAQSFLLTEDNFDQLWSKPTFFVSTRSLAVDRALGPQLLPGGRLVEIYGENGSGKSSLIDQILAETQSMNGIAGFIDAEEARDLTYMKRLGVDTDKLIISQAVTMETVFDVVRDVAVNARREFGPKVPIVLAWDSVAGTPTAEEYDNPTDQYRASAAKVLRQQCRTTMTTLAREQVLFVVANQQYKKMGQKKSFFSDEDETYGGGAIKYHASIRIAMFKQANIYPRGFDWDEAKDENGRMKSGVTVPDPIGQKTGVKIVKNKLSAPNKYRGITLMYGQGFDNRVTIFEDFLASGLIQLAGSWYKLDDKFGKTKPWQGHSWWGLADLIAADPELWPKLVTAYRAMA